MPENDDYREVRIIHPETGGIATVPDSSLPFHYLAGWTLLADDMAQPGPDGHDGDVPKPLTQAEVTKRRQDREEQFRAAEEAIAKSTADGGQDSDGKAKDGAGDSGGKAPAPGAKAAKTAGESKE